MTKIRVRVAAGVRVRVRIEAGVRVRVRIAAVTTVGVESSQGFGAGHCQHVPGESQRFPQSSLRVL